MILPKNRNEIVESLRNTVDTLGGKEPTYYELSQKVKELEIKIEKLKNKFKENL